MSNTVKLIRSTTCRATPSASDLEHGELSMNVADGKLFLKKSDNSIVAIENDTDSPPASAAIRLSACPRLLLSGAHREPQKARSQAFLPTAKLSFFTHSLRRQTSCRRNLK